MDIAGGRHAELRNGVTFAPGKFGDAFRFDGYDDDVLIGLHPALDIGPGAFTVAAWIFVNGRSQGELGAGPIFEYEWGLHTFVDGTSGPLVDVITRAGNECCLSSAGVLRPNEWNHIVIAYDPHAALLTHYVNGGPRGSIPSLAPLTDRKLHIGHRAPGSYFGMESFNGLIDEFQIYNRVLTPGEINQLSGSTPPPSDRDSDGVEDSIDNAPDIPNPGQEDFDGDGIGDVADVCRSDAENDIDADGICGDVDNAPYHPNPDQADTDSDHIPDVLDECPRDSHNDEDRDDVCGDVDNAPTISNPGQEDLDRDGIGDVADNCPTVINPDQRDADQDGIGDACEASNTPPTITELTGPTGPIQLVSGSATARIVVTFTDPDRGDSHQTTIKCGNGSTVSNDCVYSEPGVYTVTATVTDSYRNADTETFEFVVVYDPSGGFVTGGGWINYKGTACPVLCGNTAGRADFGFVSKYVKGATVPNGSTRFEFHAGTLQFASSTYEWLVVAGTKGQFKGRGTINGSGDYGFLLTAIDGSIDKFRIKIWDRAAGEENPVFDTGAEIQLDKIDGGGSIVIHSK